MRTFATLALPDSYNAAGTILVGRKVANTEFIKALFSHGPFDRFMFLCGENADARSLGAFFDGAKIDRARVVTPNVLELPSLLATNAISILHHNAADDRFLDLVWLRNRFALKALPVTGQLHSLSYPRSQIARLLGLLWPLSACDAIFSSSVAGRTVLEECLAVARERLATSGLVPVHSSPRIPVVPLGVNVDALAHGDRAHTRRILGIPTNAFVVLALARFTEFDKMDLFPLVTAFAGFSERVRAKGREPVLLLAGARQGTKTPEMVELWSKMLGVDKRVVVRVDFADDEKAGLLSAADVFVSPSDNLQETFGQTVVEAMAAGLPIVASDFNGYKETVTDDVGVRIPTTWAADLSDLADLAPALYERPLHLFLGQSMAVNLAALESALVGLCLDDAKRAAMGKAAARRARENYDWRVVIRAYEEEWQDLTVAAQALKLGDRFPHPLRMPFEKVFEHYPTCKLSPEAMLRATPLGRRVRGDYPIYPELQNLFGEQDVARAIAAADNGISAAALRASSGLDGLRGSLLVGWLLKHGLLDITSS